LRRPTLILAEDHPETAIYFAGILKERFNVLAVVADGDTLIELVKQLRPDAVVTDLGLKGLNGIAVTLKIRQSGLNLPIVIMTASADPDLKQAALAAGASEFLSKAEAGRELLSVLLHLLYPDRS